MTVGELRKMLEKYPANMEVVNGRCSDYQIIDESEWSVIRGVERLGTGGWVMRSHPTMDSAYLLREKEYLSLDGN